VAALAAWARIEGAAWVVVGPRFLSKALRLKVASVIFKGCDKMSVDGASCGQARRASQFPSYAHENISLL
jgi:hypothetical protein